MEISIEKLLKLDGLKVLDANETKDSFNHPTLIVECESNQARPKCPNCGCEIVHSKGTRKKDIRDLDVTGRHVVLRINSRSYNCQKCRKSFTEELPLIKYGESITTRLRDELAARALNSTYDELAYEYTISPTTISHAFKEWSNSKDAQRDGKVYAPRSLGIDEAHLSPEGKNDGMRGVFVDNDEHLVLEITEDRKKDTVINFLKDLRNPGTLEIVTMDMWAAYKDAVYEVFGDRVLVVVDHFHVIKELINQVMEVRKNIYDDLPAGTFKDHRNHLSLLKMNLENFDDEAKTQANRLFKAVPKLKMLFMLKESFRAIYYLDNRKEAEEAFEKWVEQIPKDDDFKPLKSFVKTVRRWHKEIFNFFDTDGASNATTEALNGVIKKVNRKGNGYSFEVLRAKILYGAGTKNYRPVIKTKSLKIPKTTKSSGAPTSMNNTFFGFTYKPTEDNYEIITQKEVEQHFGVSIKELDELIDSGKFFGEEEENDSTDYEQE